MLRDYQKACHDAVLAAWGEKPWHEEGETFRSVLVNLATSAGKTVTAGAIIESVCTRGKCLFLADTDELCEQPLNVLWTLFQIRAGLEKAGARASMMAPVVVGSAQTLAREERLFRFTADHFSYIIVDEAHRGSDRNKKITDHFPAAKVMGMTATAFRAKLADLSDYYEHVAFELGVFDLINEGYIAPLKVLTLPVKVDVSKVTKKRNGELDEDELDTTIRPYYEEICRLVLEHAPDRHLVAYLPLIKSSQEFVTIAKGMGISAYHVDGKSPNRKDLLERFGRGEFQLLSNSSLLSTGWDCLDSETEILTSDGWRGRGAIKTGDTIWAFNPENGTADIVDVESYGERAVRADEKMFTVESQYTNIRTTDGHRFYVQYPDPKKRGKPNGRFLIKTGRQVAAHRHYLYPVSADGRFPGVNLTDDELRFIAWLMTDGYVDSGDVAFIAQSKPDTTKRIEALLSRLNFSATKRTRQRTSNYGSGTLTEFRIPRVQWKRLALYFDKRLSGSLWGMTAWQFEVFWSELLLGDGERCKNKSGWLWCNNRELADNLTMMAVLRGYSTSCREKVTLHGFTMFVVGARKKALMQVGPNTLTPTRMSLEPAIQGEIVWCVSNRLETLIIRRRGKVSIVGNCPRCDCLLNLTPTKSPGLFRQKVGRIGRVLPGIVDGIEDKAARRNAIAVSRKPDALILDLLWQTEKFELQGPSDLISENEREKKEIQARLAMGGEARDLQEVTAEVQEAHEQRLKEALEKASIEAAAARTVWSDTIGLVATMLHGRKVLNYEPVMRWERKPVTEKQAKWLTKEGIDPGSAKDSGHAHTFMSLIFGRNKLKLCSWRAVKLLEAAGVKGAINVTAKTAFDILGGNYPMGFSARFKGVRLKAVPVWFWEWCEKESAKPGPRAGWFERDNPIEWRWSRAILYPDGECKCIGAYKAPNCPVHPREPESIVISHTDKEPLTVERDEFDLFR